MILMKILENDLHRSSRPSVLYVEVPCKPDWLPIVVSTTRGKFVPVNRLREGSMAWAGAFEYDSSKFDQLIQPLFECAFSMSQSGVFKNIFSDPDAAYSHVQESHDSKVEPPYLLVPDTITDKALRKLLGPKNVKGTEQKFTYKTKTSVFRCNIKYPVFLTVPTHVGIHIRTLGKFSSILLHNVGLSMAFFPS